MLVGGYRTHGVSFRLSLILALTFSAFIAMVIAGAVILFICFKLGKQKAPPMVSGRSVPQDSTVSEEEAAEDPFGAEEEAAPAEEEAAPAEEETGDPFGKEEA